MDRLDSELRFGATPRILDALSTARECKEPNTLLDALDQNPKELTLQVHAQHIVGKLIGTVGDSSDSRACQVRDNGVNYRCSLCKSSVVAGEKIWLHELMDGAQLKPARLKDPPKVFRGSVLGLNAKRANAGSSCGGDARQATS